jgi:2-iminobutanoate/2-iminopropanoate deaminase
MMAGMLRIRMGPKLMLAVIFLLAAIYASSASSKRRVVTPQGFDKSRPFSAGIQVADTLYVSGQTGTDPKTNKVPDNFEDEVKQCLANIRGILQAGGMDYADVVAVTVYMTDIDQFQRMNAVYTQTFQEPRPTRTTVGVTRLAGAGAHIEITVAARK